VVSGGGFAGRSVDGIQGEVGEYLAWPARNAMMIGLRRGEGPHRGPRGPAGTVVVRPRGEVFVSSSEGRGRGMPLVANRGWRLTPPWGGGDPDAVVRLPSRRSASRPGLPPGEVFKRGVSRLDV